MSVTFIFSQGEKGMMSGEGEYNTNVPDKEERKKTRRRRIDKRHATDETGGDEETNMNQGITKNGLQQVAESLFHLDKRKHGGIQDVTSVRVRTDEAESRRRVEDEKMRHERLTKLQQEALSSAKANAAIEMKWAELLEKEIPQELHHDIQQQMAACAAIISSKDALTNEFLMQLRAKDEEYVRALRQQSEDIENLLNQIRSEFKEMQTEYDKEIDAIEDAYLEERDKLIADHTLEIDLLFDNRKNKEIFYKETKQKREESYQREIEELITKGADQYNKLKIELEINIQTLKQQLEEIRATYQLNTEKLDYNYRVLTELDVEKNSELTRYKRRLTKLKDQLNFYTSKYHQMNALDTKMNNDLTEDYRRLTSKYKDLQAKFRHFEISDTNKFNEVWSMHEEEAKDVIDMLLKADKVLTEQQLGWVWKPPDMMIFNKMMMASAVAGGGAGGGGGGISAGGMGLGKTGIGEEEERNQVSSPTAVSTTGAKGGGGGARNGPVISGSRIRSVLKLLSQEAGFLELQPQLQQNLDTLSSANTPELMELSKAEAIFKALGIKNETKVTQLLQYFFKDYDQGLMIDINTEGGGKEQEFVYDGYGNLVPKELDDHEAMTEDEELLLRFPNEDLDELREMINPESVMEAIRTFMDDTVENNDPTASLSTTNKSTGGGGEGGRGGGTSSGNHNAGGGGGGTGINNGGGGGGGNGGDDVSNKKRVNNIQNYWIQLSQIVPDASVEVWKQLETDVKNYKEILTKRAQSIAEVDVLAAQNIELKRVLNQYLGDRANDKFCIPPSQTMRVNQNITKQQTIAASKGAHKGGAAAGGKVLMSKTGPV
jgi:dynein regulatry complex protein 1